MWETGKGGGGGGGEQQKPKKKFTTASNRELNRVQQSVLISENWTQLYDVWFMWQ